MGGRGALGGIAGGTGSGEEGGWKGSGEAGGGEGEGATGGTDGGGGEGGGLRTTHEPSSRDAVESKFTAGGAIQPPDKNVLFACIIRPDFTFAEL